MKVAFGTPASGKFAKRALETGADVCMVAVTPEHRKFLTTSMQQYVVEKIQDGCPQFCPAGFDDMLKTQMPSHLSEYHEENSNDYKVDKTLGMFKKVVPKQLEPPVGTADALPPGEPPTAATNPVDAMKNALATVVAGQESADPLVAWAA